MEEQQTAAGAKPEDPNVAKAAEIHRLRLVKELELQREHILSQRTSNPHRRTALEQALVEIEEKLAELGWTLHL